MPTLNLTPVLAFGALVLGAQGCGSAQNEEPVVHVDSEDADVCVAGGESPLDQISIEADTPFFVMLEYGNFSGCYQVVEQGSCDLVVEEKTIEVTHSATLRRAGICATSKGPLRFSCAAPALAEGDYTVTTGAASLRFSVPGPARSCSYDP